MEKPPEEYEDISQVEVRLKPFLGIRPGIYLTVVYSIGAALLLFLLLFLPGIRKNGTVYTIVSDPAEAAVYVDEMYAGSTPTKVFVPRGNHSLVVSKPHFSTFRKKIATDGRVFGSWIFPKKDSIEYSFSLPDAQRFLEARLEEIANWALIGQFGPSYQAPSLISATVSDFFNSGSTDVSLLDEFLDAVLPTLNGPVFIGDYIRALFLREAHGGAPGPDAMIGVVKRVAFLVRTYPSLALLIPAALPAEIVEEYRGSDWYSGVVSRYRDVLAMYAGEQPARIADERIIGGMPFVLIPSGEYTMGMPVGNETTAELPHPASSDEFYMLKGEVSRAWYARFIADVPEWAPDNIGSLSADGLADENYLLDWDDQPRDDTPVAYVSLHSARAFAAWFTRQLPAAWQSLAARLPTETEWEWAARTHYDGSTEGLAANGPLPVKGDAGLEYMLGSLWEWCDTWFHAADYFLYPWVPEISGSTAPTFDTGAEAVVRGGSWANNEDDRVTIVTRGSQPPDWCTPFTGFRVVLVGN